MSTQPLFGNYTGKRTDPRKHYRQQPGCDQAIFQVIGANCLVHAPSGLPGNHLFLLQRRRDGTYGAIGGAGDLFVDEAGNVVGFEHQYDTLRREFWEETGSILHENPGIWKYIGCYTSVVHYRKYPDVHGVGTYFSIETTPERIQEYAAGGSREGDIIILNTYEVLRALQDGMVFANTEPALRYLLQGWCLLPANG